MIGFWWTFLQMSWHDLLLFTFRPSMLTHRVGYRGGTQPLMWVWWGSRTLHSPPGMIPREVNLLICYMLVTFSVLLLCSSAAGAVMSCLIRNILNRSHVRLICSFMAWTCLRGLHPRKWWVYTPSAGLISVGLVNAACVCGFLLVGVAKEGKYPLR